MLAVQVLTRSPEPVVAQGHEPWWEHRFPAMGSHVHVLGRGGPPDLAPVAERFVAGLERSWSRFIPDSDLCRLNDHDAWSVEVPPTLARAVHRAVLGCELTGGRFDPTVLDALVAAGYDRTFRQVGERSVAPPVGQAVPGVAGVRVDPEGPTVVRPPGLHLDLGGIGKGLAADLLTTELVARGARSVSVAMGGDVRVGGEPPADGWRVPVEDPFDESSTLMHVVLDHGAIVCSSSRYRRWQTDDGGWAHHLIDPSTGRPADRGVVAAVVVAGEAWWAEVLAKAALVAGPADGVSLLRHHGVEGWLVLDDTEVVAVTR